ncbi:MAG: hypothetical protein BWY73_01629 [candidate division TA06 bacterium ADurb.Bin417]|uniref:Uncharacterized protein n=1 Tax=candidate division TA06 bacterium ADurb.Bin417 TaxID=1852828 RepID=A0A1V5M635_UNCT6|nr:MAG: hypothetical protein BWY73_01629 [candidate division TA06 bacterium ADurb.Bin417]
MALHRQPAGGQHPNVPGNRRPGLQGDCGPDLELADGARPERLVPGHPRFPRGDLVRAVQRVLHAVLEGMDPERETRPERQSDPLPGFAGQPGRTGGIDRRRLLRPLRTARVRRIPRPLHGPAPRREPGLSRHLPAKNPVRHGPGPDGRPGGRADREVAPSLPRRLLRPVGPSRSGDEAGPGRPVRHLDRHPESGGPEGDRTGRSAGQVRNHAHLQLQHGQAEGTRHPVPQTHRGR